VSTGACLVPDADIPELPLALRPRLAYYIVILYLHPDSVSAVHSATGARASPATHGTCVMIADQVLDEGALLWRFAGFTVPASTSQPKVHDSATGNLECENRPGFCVSPGLAAFLLCDYPGHATRLRQIIGRRRHRVECRSHGEGEGIERLTTQALCDTRPVPTKAPSHSRLPLRLGLASAPRAASGGSSLIHLQPASRPGTF